MKLYQKLFIDFEEMYLAHATLGIIASSCLGSIAAMLVLMKGHAFINMFELFLIVVVCMGFNASVLAQMKPKFVFNTLIVSLSVSTLLIFINLI